MTSLAAPAVSPFDGVAAEYDARFTHTRVGRLHRELIRERLRGVFGAGDSVLELGCGTGEDAVWLAALGVNVLATDASGEMLAVARRKADALGVTDRVRLARFDFESGAAQDELPDLGPGASPFDGVLSNFGALNCAADRTALAARLAACVRRGGRMAVVLMGPLCAWEIGWHVCHGDVRRAFRRRRDGAEAHVGSGARVRVWYPSPARLRTELRPWFRHRRTFGIGIVTPPSDLGGVMERRPRAFALLSAADRRLAAVWPSASISDHYLSIFERT